MLQARFILFAPVELKQRISAALITRYRPPGSGRPLQVQYSILPLYTKQLAATDKYYIVLPKRKIQTGIRKHLELLVDFDILANSEVTAGWGRFGGGIGEQDQFRRCNTTGGTDTTEELIKVQMQGGFDDQASAMAWICDEFTSRRSSYWCGTHYNIGDTSYTVGNIDCDFDDLPWVEN